MSMFLTKQPKSNKPKSNTNKPDKSTTNSKNDKSKANKATMKEIEVLTEIVNNLTEKVSNLSFALQDKLEFLSPTQLSQVIENEHPSLVGLVYKDAKVELDKLLENKKIDTKEAYFYKRFIKDTKQVNKYYELIKDAKYIELYEKIR